MKCKTYHASQKMPYRLLYMANVITVNRTTLNGDKMYYSIRRRLAVPSINSTYMMHFLSLRKTFFLHTAT